MKVAIVCSSGGHLFCLYNLRAWWEKHERVWVTFEKEDAKSLLAGEETVWAFHPTTRSVLNLLRNTRLAWRTLRAVRPDVVVSSGAGVALPFFLVARLLGIKTVFIEAYERIDTRSLTGRLCYPLSNLFLLQWKEQERLYPRGRLIGRLL